MAQDEIWVEHRKVDEKTTNTVLEEAVYAEQFHSLLLTSDHSDIKFVVGDPSEEVFAHKAILSARSEYFRVMFKKGGMSESTLSSITVLDHTSSAFRMMLEYIYCNRVRDLENCDLASIVSLLILANEYCLDRLQYLCEVAASRCLDNENIARTTLLSMNYDLQKLKLECKSFLSKNVVELRRDSKFRKEVEDSPQLGLFLFDAWPEDDGEGSSKRRCVSEGVNRDSPLLVPVVPSQALQTEVHANNVANW